MFLPVGSLKNDWQLMMSMQSAGNKGSMAAVGRVLTMNAMKI